MSAIVAQVEGRQVRLTSLTRVMYPSMRITKSQVIDYYATVGPSIIGQTLGRPVTRIRFPHGVGGQSFFEKNAPDGIPEWIPQVIITPSGTRCSTKSSIVCWVGGINALELQRRRAVARAPAAWTDWWSTRTPVRFWTDAVLRGVRWWHGPPRRRRPHPAWRAVQAVRRSECNRTCRPGSCAMQAVMNYGTIDRPADLAGNTRIVVATMTKSAEKRLQ